MFTGQYSNLRNISTHHEYGMHKSPDQSRDAQSLFQTNTTHKHLTLVRTKRLQRLGVSSIYSNHDGNCKGASRHFLEQFAIANQNIHIRSKLKDQLICGLKVQKKAIIDQEVAEKIIKYQSNHKWASESLTYIQSLHNEVSQLPILIMDMIYLMKLNNLDNLYNEICTYEHMTVMIISQDNNIIKLIYYDPSDGTYYKVRLTNEELNLNNLANIVNSMTYFINRQELYVYANCYSPTNNIITYYKSSLNLTVLPEDIEGKQQYLMLAIGVDDFKLTQNILELSHLDLKFICDGVTPLSLATANRNFDIIKLLTYQNKDIINFLDRKRYSPLGIAVYQRDLRTAKLLLELGASPDYPKGFCNPLKIAQADNNHEMYKLLKPYSQDPQCTIL